MAIVICRERLNPEEIPALATTEGVCVKLRLWFGIGTALEFLERVLQHANGPMVFVDMDANACSPAWHCKTASVDRRRPRGERLAQWFGDHRMVVLNRPSERFTYVGRGGRSSDIDVTVRTRKWPHQCSFEWTVLDVGVRDHNVLETRIMDAGPVAEQACAAEAVMERCVVPMVT